MRSCLYDYRPMWIRLLFTIACGGLLAVAGCASEPPEVGGILAGAPVAEGTGNWNDIHAAVLVAAEKSDSAIVKVYEPAPDRRLFRLQTVRSEIVWLEVTRVDAPDGVAEVRMRARIGRFGDVERERALMRRVAERLKRLEGVGYRPVS